MAINKFKNHKTNTDETQRKNRIINNAVALYNNYLTLTKKKLSMKLAIKLLIKLF